MVSFSVRLDITGTNPLVSRTPDLTLFVTTPIFDNDFISLQEYNEVNICLMVASKT